MNPQTIRKLDAALGKPACFLLTLWRRILSPFEPAPPPAGDPPKKILLIKMTEQGATVAAWRAMTRAIEMVGRDNVYFWVFAENRPILDMMEMIPPENVITINAKGLFTTLRDMLGSILRIRRLGIDATVDMEFFARSSAILGYLTGARRRVGLHRYTMDGPYRGDLLTHRVEWNPYLHVAVHYWTLVETLLRDPRERPLPKIDVPRDLAVAPPKIRIAPEELGAIRQLLAKEAGGAVVGPRVVLLNPNASDMLPLRRWASERFVELGRRILAVWPDVTIVFTGAPGEREGAEAMARDVAGGTRCLSVAGKTTLRQLFALYEVSDVLVTNDSGPGHFSSLTDISPIVLFGPETPALFGPTGKRSLVVWSGIACSPCVNALNHRHSPCNDNVCMKMITVEHVFARVEEALSRRAASPASQ